MMMQALDDIGDRSAPVGSRPWCAALRLHARVAIDDTNSQVGALKYTLKDIREGEFYKTLQDRDGRDFATWEDFVQTAWPYGLGFRVDVANALIAEADASKLVKVVAAEVMAKTEPARRHGRPGKSDGKADNVSFYGNGASYLAARIKRDHPDIAEAVERGEYRSMRAAAIAAGIIRQKTPFDRLLSAWRKASVEERSEFLEAIGQS